MSRIKSNDTRPEKILRTYLHKSGFRYRLRYELYGKPDIVFPKKRVAIFVHGCFWHQHGCKNSVIPKTNTEFWRGKLNKNVLRDRKVLNFLKNSGWKQVVIWECELEKDLEASVIPLVKFLK